MRVLGVAALGAFVRRGGVGGVDLPIPADDARL